jgi:hypothetical protein
VVNQAFALPAYRRLVASRADTQEVTQPVPSRFALFDANTLRLGGYFSSTKPSASAHSRNPFAAKSCSSDVDAADIDRNTPARV